MPDTETMNIGAVIAHLKPEFPDLTASKVRYLEAEGLITPMRSAAGYRRYLDKDLARLAWVLRQQRDRFLPLKVIAELLTAGEFEAETNEEDSSTGSGTVSAFRERLARHSLSSLSVGKSELAHMAGLHEDTVEELERLDLIQGRSAGQSKVYDDEAVLVAKVAACFIEHGFDARHLRGHLVSAQREAGLLEQAVRPHAAGGERATERTRVATRQLVDELVDAGSTLHELLLRRELGDLGR